MYTDNTNSSPGFFHTPHQDNNEPTNHNRRLLQDSIEALTGLKFGVQMYLFVHVVAHVTTIFILL